MSEQRVSFKSADTDHFMFAESNTRVYSVVRDWLTQYFSVKVAPSGMHG